MDLTLSAEEREGRCAGPDLRPGVDVVDQSLPVLSGYDVTKEEET